MGSTVPGDRFELSRRLGEGAFGVVYEAYDRKRRERMALKQLRATDSAALRRFKNEFRALAGVTHPNLIRLGELIGAEDSWFFTMELIEGTDLLAHVRPTAGGFRGGFDEARLRDAFGQLAEGISALHSHGMIHRDLKPSNVLVGPKERVVVLDFGLVSSLGPEETSRSITMAGTPAYMSPEQLDGLPVSPASDWYGVGVMLFEALTGRVPFQGSLYQMIVARRESEPPAPRQVADGVPEDLDALCRALLRPDPSARPDGDEILERLRGSVGPQWDRAPAPEPREGGPTFVGRRTQLATMEEALAEVRGGRCATILVKGLSGMGKTALVRRFLTGLEADNDVLVLQGKCYQRESVPYKALDSLVDALSHHLHEMDPERAARYMPRDWPAVARLFPVLAEVAVGLRRGRAGIDVPDAQELRRRGFAALRELLGRLAEEVVLVLFIDDLHWGDVDSGLLLREIMRAPDPPPLLFIASYRSDEIESSTLLRMLEERRDPTIFRRDIEVDELSPEETRQLAMARIGAETADARARAEVLARESRGNPFFVDELARHQGTGGRISGALQLESMIGARLAGLAEDARGLLEVIAVSGRPIRLAAANQAAGLDPRNANTIAVLQAEHWVRRRAAATDEEVFEVYHDRIRDTVVSLVPEDDLPSYHNRVAVALDASGLADAETLAEHYQQAGEHHSAARHALRAAHQAAEALGFDRAARLYRMSFELGKHAGDEARVLLTSLAAALVNAGRGGEAAEAYLAAARFSSSREEAMELERAAAEQFLISGRVDEGLEVLRRVLDHVGMRLSRTPRGAFLELLWRRVQLQWRGLEFEPRRESEVPKALLQKVDVCWSAAIGLAMVDVMRSTPYQAKNVLWALRAGEPYRATRALIMEMAFSSVGGGRTRRRTRKIEERCRALVAEVVHPHTDGLFAMTQGVAANLEGRFAECLEHLERADRILRERCTGMNWELDNVHIYSLVALSHMGAWGEIRRRAEPLFEEARERNDHFLRTHIETRQLFLLRLMDDDPAGAGEVQELALDSWSGSGFQVPHYWDWYARGEIDLYAGRIEEASRSLDDRWGEYRRSLLPYTQAIQTEILFLRVRVALALATALTTRAEGALRRVARDIRSLDGHDTKWSEALASVSRALAATLEPDRDRLRELLEVAEPSLRSAGLAHYAWSVRWRLGDLLGGDAGGAMAADAQTWMLDQGIRNPERTRAMLTPGSWA